MSRLTDEQLVVNKLEAERDAAISQVGKLARELGQQDARIKDLESINESHQKLNGELRERIKELEGTAITKDEAERLIELITSFYVENYNEDFRKVAKSGFAKLQKIIDKRG